MYIGNMPLITTLLLLTTATLAAAERALDPADFLRAELMPASLLLASTAAPSTTPATPASARLRPPTSTNGSVSSAWLTMSFHRQMMNEYLCRGFLAEKIISEMNGQRLENRVGKPFALPDNNQSLSRPQDSVFLADQGSKGYTDWLSKVATLEDIYHHNFPHSRRESSGADRQQAAPKSPEGYEVYEDSSGFTLPDLHTGYPVSHKYSGGYEYPAAPPYHQPSFEVEHEETERHGLGLRDLFEISLTALAFLSFGMFALQVIMCIGNIGMNKPHMTMQMVDGSDDTMNIDETIRFRRAAPRDLPPELEEIARAALRSLRPARAPECRHYAICEGNRYAQSIKYEGRIWLPVWNFAVSWIKDGATLAGLRASVLGLGGANCSAIYSPSQC